MLCPMLIHYKFSEESLVSKIYFGFELQNKIEASDKILNKAGTSF